MWSVPEDVFDDEIAKHYEQRWPEVFHPDVVEPIVDFLAERANGGPALEFAVGTGRVALPLSRRGIRVDGIEISHAMVRQLREKAGAEEIDVTVGDMATTQLASRYRLV